MHQETGGRQVCPDGRLCAAPQVLHGNMDTTQQKHVSLNLILLRRLPAALKPRYAELWPQHPGIAELSIVGARP